MQDEGAVVFNCLQGGIGEDGRLQSVLERAGVRFTGSNELASAICADKLDTAEQLQARRAPQHVPRFLQTHRMASRLLAQGVRL